MTPSAERTHSKRVERMLYNATTMGARVIASGLRVMIEHMADFAETIARNTLILHFLIEFHLIRTEIL